MVSGPVRGDRQLQAARQGRTVPSGLLPDPGRLGDPPPGPQVVLPGVDPGPQPRPGSQQRVVGDLRVVRVHGDQPLADEPAEHVDGTGAPAVQFGQRDDAAGRRRVVGDVHQAQEQPPGHLLLAVGELGENALGGPGDRVGDPAAGPVVRDRDRAGAAELPGAEQGVREQGERAGLVRALRVGRRQAPGPAAAARPARLPPPGAPAGQAPRRPAGPVRRSSARARPAGTAARWPAPGSAAPDRRSRRGAPGSRWLS